MNQDIMSTEVNGDQTVRMDGSANQLGAASQSLATSAPVSSLLPQLANGLFQGPQQPNLLNQAIQQARYAMLLQAAGTLEQQGASSSNPLAGLATLSQHLNNQNAFTSSQSVAAASISSAPTPSVNTAAQLLATRSAVSALTASQQHYGHHQTLASLENQVNLLQKLNQPVPQTLTLLLADARRREEKKHAKRIANRRSASTSRARKKALVQEMTDLNARLRRQALILSLLPDLVIVTDADGVITFCSEQVERVLGYSSSITIGNAIPNLLVPSSRNKMNKLIRALTETESGAAGDENLEQLKQKQVPEDASNEQRDTTEANMSGIPLSVVQVDVKGARDDADNSDASRDSNKLASSLTGSTGSVPRSPNPGLDDNNKAKEALATGATKTSDKESSASDDNSNASSLSADGEAAQDAARNLQNANANLERNVRWHNKNMNMGARSDTKFKDDVIGATVTANNASARLSSLRVHEDEDLVLNKGDKNTMSSEDDSGYRESNDSREETSSSTFSDTSSKEGRRKPMAPTCNVCLIRDDLTTIWCEVTSSIRTRCVKQDDHFDLMLDEPKSKASGSSYASDTESLHETVREIYLCLRPIRAGRQKVNEKYRFPQAGLVGVPVSEGSKTALSSGEGYSSQDAHEKMVSLNDFASSPPKKRKSRGFDGSAKKVKSDTCVR